MAKEAINVNITQKRTPAKAMQLYQAAIGKDGQGPDPKAIEAFRRHLIQHPEDAAELGDMNVVVRQCVSNSIGKGADTPALGTASIGALESLERNLGRDSSPPLEQLLIQQIGTCWLHLSDVSMKHAMQCYNGTEGATMLYWEKRVSIAQARYLAAINALAKVRKLKLPAVQVNIAENQINVSR